LCALAEVSPWSILSREPGRVVGQLVKVAALADVQTVTYTTPTLLLCEHLGGEEEIPPGVVGVVLLGNSPDVLCHAAVRARNMKVPLVCNRADGMGDALGPLVGHAVTLAITGGDVNLTLAPDGSLDQSVSEDESAGDAGTSDTASALVRAGEWTGDWGVTPQQYQRDQVGAKSLSTGKLQKLLQDRGDSGRSRLPAWCHSPSSVTLPYGVYPAVLHHPSNAGVKGELEGMLQQLRHCKGEEIAEQLQRIR
jgi:alpha-glucan,water dikinase